MLDLYSLFKGGDLRSQLIHLVLLIGDRLLQLVLRLSMLPHRVRHLQILLCHISSEFGNFAVFFLSLLGEADGDLLHGNDLVFDLVVGCGRLGMLLLHSAKLLIHTLQVLLQALYLLLLRLFVSHMLGASRLEKCMLSLDLVQFKLKLLD